ncbi:hypothetical protein NA57DRAFT_51143 [Rhizodiscina lignyota]|uniref:Uncharacterized protein n=1 Tax=Rhizodiscina lignyota TaxID=1504668 RepID=A0A9P4IS00_9PEZI|nr:hypothetical protein NA57DRAFT_51143 [Rhizodiscina lignyota]
MSPTTQTGRTLDGNDSSVTVNKATPAGDPPQSTQEQNGFRTKRCLHLRCGRRSCIALRRRLSGKYVVETAEDLERRRRSNGPSAETERALHELERHRPSNSPSVEIVGASTWSQAGNHSDSRAVKTDRAVRGPPSAEKLAGFRRSLSKRNQEHWIKMVKYASQGDALGQLLQETFESLIMEDAAEKMIIPGATPLKKGFICARVIRSMRKC